MRTRCRRLSRQLSMATNVFQLCAVAEAPPDCANYDDDDDDKEHRTSNAGASAAIVNSPERKIRTTMATSAKRLGTQMYSERSAVAGNFFPATLTFTSLCYLRDPRHAHAALRCRCGCACGRRCGRLRRGAPILAAWFRTIKGRHLTSSSAAIQSVHSLDHSVGTKAKTAAARRRRRSAGHCLRSRPPERRSAELLGLCAHTHN